MSNWTLAKESEFRVVYKGLDVRGLLLEEAGERHKRSRDEGESDGDMTLYVFKEEEDFKVVKQPSSHFFPKKTQANKQKCAITSMYHSYRGFTPSALLTNELELRFVGLVRFPERFGKTRKIVKFLKHASSLQILSTGLTDLDLASSVWLVFASNASSLGESASPLLTLESMFFVLEGGDLVREWYRVSQDVPVIKMDYARVSQDGLELLGESQYLWDRREDLGGIAFR